MANLKLQYNSPVILTFTLMVIGVFLFDHFLNGFVNNLLALSPTFNATSIRSYTSLFTYGFAHANIPHIFGNMSIILLIGPILEEKYGSRTILSMMILTSLVTAILNILFFDTGLIGASGLVFMMIVLVSFTNVRAGEIPLTFILVLLVFVGKEVWGSFEEDNISQFAHIIGGLCGSLFGFVIINKRLAS